MLSPSMECEHVYAVAFAFGGKYLVSSGDDKVQVWRLQESQQLEAVHVLCVGVSKNGRWIAAGTGLGEVIVWNAETYEQVLKHRALDQYINGVDFSPDSTHLVTASDVDRAATVWSVAGWKQVQTLKHDSWVRAAKYSLAGDRIATATHKSVRIWDANNGLLLADIPVMVAPFYNRGLAWTSDHLFVLSNGKIVKLDPSSGSTVSEQVVHIGQDSSIALPQHGRFVAYSTKGAVKFWDTSTRTELGVIKDNQDIYSIAFSQDGQFIAIGGRGRRIAVKRLSAAFNDATFDPLTHPPLLKEWVKSMLLSNSWKDILITPLNFVGPKFALYHAICDDLEASNNVADAVECFRQMQNELITELNTNNVWAKWATDFQRRCAEKLTCLGDTAADARQFDIAIGHYSVVLSLNPAVPLDILIRRGKAFVAKGLWQDALDDADQAIKLDSLSPWNHEGVLKEWANVKLMDGSWKGALSSASTLKVPRLTIYKTICKHLGLVGRIQDATECLHEMTHELGQEAERKEAQWILDFKTHCCKKLVDRGRNATRAQRYEEGFSHFSAALRMNPIIPQALFVDRSVVRAARGVWEDLLDDANKTITLAPESQFGYQQKYVALCGVGLYKDALDAFETMLLKMSESKSPNLDIRVHYHRCKNRREVIRKAIQDVTRDLPRVLIDTTSGRLCDRSEQASAFEASPAFIELISSSTTHVNSQRIEKEVENYYRYGMFSHRWEDQEPLFDKVMHVAVYDLNGFPTHDKLQMFCKIVWDAGFRWAWSDTCCINKGDNFVLQEALVSMFTWYQGSSLTIVFLRGVCSPSQHGDLADSNWNSRAWTFQEYHASKVVRFYNEDWTLYRNLDIPNHKESPEIISEMEEATGVSAQALSRLRPGLDNIWEKLCLASQRETTLIEDAAYSLFGIFNVSFSIVYGERDRAIGRLLARLLTGAGDTTILAWTGRSGNFNSCLPAVISVFSHLPTTLIPPAISCAEMDQLTARLQISPHSVTSIMNLYDRLHRLPVPSFLDNRMKLPCIFFPLGRVFGGQNPLERVFHAKSTVLGDVEIRTRDDPSQLGSLILVYPWIDFLLDRRPLKDVDGSTSCPNSPTDSYTTWSTTSATRDAESFSSAPSVPSTCSVEREALRFLARLRQPFGALLLTQNRRNVLEYRRVAADCIIRVKIPDDAPLDDLVAHARVLDVL